MITAVHTLVYADDPDAARAFFRDVLGLPNLDAGDGWLLFATGPSELGVHPTDAPPRHEISLMCDDLERTMTDLAARGARFEGEIAERGFGRCVDLRVPGAGTMLLYQPRHPLAYPLAGGKA
ncbi:VOC family protein [Nocardia beijingensis]|uniref:VOC family protein n=1 Tax=Nocardia beijingensis TaxID=95162 RepID=UPI0018941E47|nr:VOC family protein [Nocardia beijingensis]MBF6075667.1 VOC family protein [Nocardia beijingensis]